MEEIGRQIEVLLKDGSCVTGWDFGKSPLGIYVALDRDATEIRFIPEGMWQSATFYYADIIDIKSTIKDFYAQDIERKYKDDSSIKELSTDLIHSLDRTDFNTIRKLSRDFEKHRQKLEGHYDFLSIDNIEENLTEAINTVLETRYLYIQLLNELEKSNLTTILDKYSEVLRKSDIPLYDWYIYERLQGKFHLESMLFKARNEPTFTEDGGKRQLEQLKPEVIIDSLRSQELQNDNIFKSKWPKRLRIVAATGKIVVGGSLTTANIAAGLLAGIVTTLPTLGIGAIAGAVGVATSAYTGLNAACDGIKDFATAIES